ncbi:MAG: type IV pilus modification PilV family protein [Chthoniobacterales bacterium]
MTALFRRHNADHGSAFSLVEVVLALGVVGFAIVAILGVVPIGLSAGRGAQDESRAAQIAQSILAGLASQKFDAVAIPLFDANGTQTGSVPFNLTSQTGTVTWAANNEGEPFVPGQTTFLISPPSKPVDTAKTYNVVLLFNSAPAGFDTGYANLITLTVSWPATAQPAAQTRRSFMRLISKY